MDPNRLCLVVPLCGSAPHWMPGNRQSEETQSQLSRVVHRQEGEAKCHSGQSGAWLEGGTDEVSSEEAGMGTHSREEGGNMECSFQVI